MVDEPAEIFDDMYLGLRAGAAGRKKRRGEPLSAEEQEALGRWQRLSTWRKSLAVGGFAVGTFGLGFTLGGLVFGRWRKATPRPANAARDRTQRRSPCDRLHSRASSLSSFASDAERTGQRPELSFLAGKRTAGVSSAGLR